MKKHAILLRADGQPLNQSKETQVQYAGPIPHAAHCTPNGYLANTPGQYALWYFIRCAHQAVLNIPTQITTTDEDDSKADLKGMAQSIAQIYGVELQDMFSEEHWRRAKAEAESSKMPMHDDVVVFVQSGGQRKRHYDRDADSHGKVN